MKLNELTNPNVNAAMIKVTRRRRNSEKSQNLIMGHLNRKTAVDQVHGVMNQIMNKYLADDPAEFSVKIVEQQPVIFNIISPTANDYFQFTINFPDGMEEIARALLDKISKTPSV
jgi:hypothetical protein